MFSPYSHYLSPKMIKMKKSIYHLSFIALIVSLTLTSCVSGKKFTASEARANKLQKENATTQSQLNDSKIHINSITALLYWGAVFFLCRA